LPFNRKTLAAAPSYLKKKGRPNRVEDLNDHACLTSHSNGKPHDRWVFPDAGNDLTVRVAGPIISDDTDVIRQCAIAGEGILYRSWLDICQDVSAGHLEVLLPDLPGERLPLQFICPHRKQLSTSIRSLYSHLKNRFEQLAGNGSGGGRF